MTNVSVTDFVSVAILEDGDFALVIREEHHASYAGTSPVFVLPYGSTVPVIDWARKISQGRDHVEWAVAFNRPGTPGVWLAVFRASENGRDYYREWTGVDPRHEWMFETSDFNEVDIEAFIL